jgi:uroporphyrinogen-III synthase
MEDEGSNILCTAAVTEAVKAKLEHRPGVQVDYISFIQTVPVTNEVTLERVQQFSGEKLPVVFTSIEAVKAVSTAMTDLPRWNIIYAIEGNTAAKAQEYFKINNIITASSAAALAQKIIDAGDSAAIFFCGDKRLDVLPAMLASAGIELKELVVYTTKETPEQVKEKYSSVIFFSPSAVHSFFSINSLAAGVPVYAIGPTTATAVQQYTNNQLITAAVADKALLIQSAIYHAAGINK